MCYFFLHARATRAFYLVYYKRSSFLLCITTGRFIFLLRLYDSGRLSLISPGKHLINWNTFSFYIMCFFLNFFLQKSNQVLNFFLNRFYCSENDIEDIQKVAMSPYALYCMLGCNRSTYLVHICSS